jgi:hypothetical protein
VQQYIVTSKVSFDLDIDINANTNYMPAITIEATAYVPVTWTADRVKDKLDWKTYVRYSTALNLFKTPALLDNESKYKRICKTKATLEHVTSGKMYRTVWNLICPDYTEKEEVVHLIVASAEDKQYGFPANKLFMYDINVRLKEAIRLSKAEELAYLDDRLMDFPIGKLPNPPFTKDAKYPPLKQSNQYAYVIRGIDYEQKQTIFKYAFQQLCGGPNASGTIDTEHSKTEQSHTQVGAYMQPWGEMLSLGPCIRCYVTNEVYFYYVIVQILVKK